MTRSPSRDRGVALLPLHFPLRLPLRLPLQLQLLLPLLLVLLLGSCTLVGAHPRAPAPVDGAEGGRAPGAAGPPGGRVEGARAPDAAPERGLPGVEGREEVRALWVVRTALSHPDSVRLMVRRAERAGFNTLLIQVRGRGDALYRSALEPSSELLRGADGDFDPLALALDEAHARGIAVHAWINVHLVHGVGELPVDRSHLVRSRPELLAVPRDLVAELDEVDPRDPRYVTALLDWARANQDRIEGLYTSPSDPRVSRHLVAVVEDFLARYPVDGIHLDYVRYASPDFDYSSGARARFRDWVAGWLDRETAAVLDRRAESDPLAYPDALPALWDDFRRSRITELMRELHRTVREVRPEAFVSAAVRADHGDAYRYRYQDWTGWLDAGVVDAVAPMAYTEDPELFRLWVDRAVRRAGGSRVWAGIGVYKTTLRGTLDQIGIARSEGAAGVALFSYDWAVAEARSDRPDFSFLERVGEEAFGGAGLLD